MAIFCHFIPPFPYLRACEDSGPVSSRQLRGGE